MGRIAAIALVLSILACSGDEAPLLTVISYNVKGLDWTPGSTPSYPEAVRLEDLVTTLAAHPADVIGLQEVRKKSNGPSLADELAEALGGYHVLTATTTSIWMPYVQQNAILSRLPLAAEEELDLGEDPGGTEHRRFQYARIQLPEGRVVHLGNVHLFTDSSKQLPALQAIEAFLQDRLGAREPFVWTGDFNFEPAAKDASSPYAYLTGQLSLPLADPLATLGRPLDDRAVFTSSAETPRKRIDFVFVSPSVSVVDYATISDPVPNRTYPDHLAVKAELGIPPP